MYANYAHLAGATAANVLADITALVTGETNIANLSASCNKVNSYIVNTASSAGWTLHDDAASATSKVYKTVYSDDPSKFHYVQVTVTATTIMLNAYESWNATTHVGTNGGYGPSTSTIDLSVSNVIHFSVSSMHLAVFPAASSVPQFFGERSRRTVWDTVANGYPTGVLIAPTYTSVPRLLGYNGTDYTSVITSNWSPYWQEQQNAAAANHGWTGTLAQSSSINSTHGTVMSGFGNFSAFYPDAFYPDATKSRTHALLPFGVIGVSSGASTSAGQPSNPYTKGFLGGEVSSKSDMWLTTWGYGSSFDELTSGDDTYIIWGYGSGGRTAVRKG